MSLKKITLVLGLLAVAGTSMAAPEALSHAYAGAGMGFADTGWVGRDSTGLGININGGYQFNSMWSVEGGFIHFPDATSSGASSISTNALYAVGKVSLPVFTSKFRAYTKFGFGNVFDSGASSASHLGWVMAYGIDLPLEQDLTIDAGYTHFVGKYTDSLSTSVPNADYYAVTVNYQLPARLFS